MYEVKNKINIYFSSLALLSTVPNISATPSGGGSARYWATRNWAARKRAARDRDQTATSMNFSFKVCYI